jgi:hypothetical protein
VGGGFLASQFVPSNAVTNFTFPFSIQYDPTTDTNNAMLTDIATKCGLLGGTKQSLTINYKINLAVKVLFITVHPSVSSSANFDCPISVRVFPSSLCVGCDMILINAISFPLRTVNCPSFHQESSAVSFHPIPPQLHPPQTSAKVLMALMQAMEVMMKVAAETNRCVCVCCTFSLICI